MSMVHFYEKPGCMNNGRQKRLLAAAGYTLVVHDLLQTRWDGAELRSFFGGMPVRDWFNPSAPAVKNAEIDPDALDEAEAIALLRKEPLLIRRPLLDWDGGRCAGFDPAALASIGLALRSGAEAPETCDRPETQRGCG